MGQPLGSRQGFVQQDSRSGEPETDPPSRAGQREQQMIAGIAGANRPSCDRHGHNARREPGVEMFLPERFDEPENFRQPRVAGICSNAVHGATKGMTSTSGQKRGWRSRANGLARRDQFLAGGAQKAWP
jgi:hypothetical protein